MLDLFAHVVQRDGLQRRIIAIVGALAVLVRCFQLFHQRDDRLMHRQSLLAQTLARRMQSFA